MKTCCTQNYINTNDLFQKLKILSIEQLSNKLSIVKLHMHKNIYKIHFNHNSKG
jgi:hypothetical protein